MSENFVRKDTFDEVMRRIEAMMAASEARNSAQIAEIRGEVKELKAVVEGYGDTLTITVEALNNRSSRWANVIGAVMAFAAVVVAAVSVYVGVFK